MKKIYLVIVLTLCIGQVFGQRIMIQSDPTEAVPIELNEVHEMVKNLADSIQVKLYYC